MLTRQILAGWLTTAIGITLLLVIPAVSHAKVSCSYAAGPKTLTVNARNDLITIRRVGDQITVRQFLADPIRCSGAPPSGPTVTNTDLVRLVHTGENFTDLELRGGPLAPGATPESEGASEIEVEYLEKGDGFVDVYGSRGRNIYSWGADGGLNLNPGVAGDLDVDLTVGGNGYGFLVAETLAGRDEVLPMGTAVRGGVFTSGGRQADVIASADGGGILWGGRGDDTITGGRGFELIEAGRGNDRVRAGKGPDGISVVDGFPDRVNCGGGRDAVRADARDRLRGCEHVTRVERGSSSRAAVSRTKARSANERRRLDMLRRWALRAG